MASGSDGKKSVRHMGHQSSIPGLGTSWRMGWLPTPVFLSGEFYGLRSLVGYNPWSRKESDMTEQCFHFSLRYNRTFFLKNITWEEEHKEVHLLHFVWLLWILKDIFAGLLVGNGNIFAYRWNTSFHCLLTCLIKSMMKSQKSFLLFLKRV